jgi:hypothetical protein
MVLEMVAWRDPNLVPIKAFYGDDLKVNFCGKLATDPHVQVRVQLHCPTCGPYSSRSGSVVTPDSQAC